MKSTIGTVMLAALCAVAPRPAGAQTTGRFEVGAQFSAMRLSQIDVTESGLGGRIGWSVNDLVALEAVADVFPAGADSVVRGGRKFNVLAGPRLSWHSGRLSLFGKSRMGLARLGEGRSDGPCIAIFPPPESCFAAETRLAFDVGGGVEVHPSPRTSLRFDIGSLITRLGDASHRFGRDGEFAADLQVSAGVGVRF